MSHRPSSDCAGASLQSPHDRLVRKLERAARLSNDDVEALRQLPLSLKRVDGGTDVVSEGDRPSHCCLLVEGFLFRYKVMPHGSRQITSLHVPGDIPDAQSVHLGVADYSLAALAPSVVAFMPHGAVLELIARHPGIAAALWRDTLIDAAIFREWIANVGRRSAYQRIAHTMCELSARMQALGLAKGGRCPFPLTQAELADATGLSVVHVNRSLQALRAAGLITLSGKTLTIPDWDALTTAAEFDPAYLHQ